MSLSELQVLALLRALHRPGERAPFRLEGDALWKGADLVPLPGSPAGNGSLARIDYLARRLGLESGRPKELADLWGAALADGSERTAWDLLSLARQGAPDPGDETERRWRTLVEARLFSTGSQADRADPEGLLRPNLRPLLEEWPATLLRHPWWSTAEAPLPNMRPLRLDDVWVDLQMLDPEEGPLLGGREAMRILLDQRFEGRRWRSEPLELILGRMSGVTAFVGPPGSGKTTLLKWIARHLVVRPDESRFLLPLFVPLRKHAAQARRVEDGGLFRSALHECGVLDLEEQRRWISLFLNLAVAGRERVLLLLDGWDEVPAEDRESLFEEVRALARRFPVLLTSRPAAFPSRLVASRVYEVADLSEAASDTLIRRWFVGAGTPEQADALVRHLDENPDLRRLARNPFLLTLLCGIRHASRRSALPTSRVDLYQETLRLIYSQHNEQPHSFRIESEQERQIERLALWLLDEAPGAPRLVFGRSDVVASGAPPDLLTKYLQPSRLLARLALDEESHCFLHATFQEYLAAQALERGPEAALRRLRAHTFDPSWQEVFHFLAHRPGRLREIFWREMARHAANPDRFGIVAARLARWVAASEARDGGVALLGRDLRDLLWPLIKGLARNALWVDAYAEVDAAGFVARASSALAPSTSRERANLQRALSRVRNPLASSALVDQVLGDDPQAAAVAAAQLQRRVDVAELWRLRSAASAGLRPEIRRQAIRALGYCRDGLALPDLVQIARNEPELAEEAVRAIGRLGGVEATRELARLLAERGGTLGPFAARALGEMKEAASRDALLDELARCPPEDPLLLPLLSALAELPLHRGTALVLDCLNEGGPEIRSAAVWALAEASGSGVQEGLVATARFDPEEAVRLAALEVLEGRVGPEEGHWLLPILKNESRSREERAYALRVLLRGSGRWTIRVGAELLARRAIEDALTDPEGDLALEAAFLAHHGGPSVGPQLIALCLDERASPAVREAACGSLGKLGDRSAVVALLSLVRAAPETEDDEDLPLAAGRGRLARAAAEALTRIDVGALLAERGTTSEHALARYSIETGCLVFADRIVGPDGREVVRLAPPARKPPASAPRAKRVQAKPGLEGADLGIEVTFRDDSGGQYLHYKLSSPNGRVILSFWEARTRTVFRLEEYRKTVVQRLEKFQQNLHATDGYLTAGGADVELKELGHELYEQLFPPEMQLLYREWRKQVRTLQIISKEVWIPWELVRPFGLDLDTAIGDDFLGARFEVTRWLLSIGSASPQIRVEGIACVEGEHAGAWLQASRAERTLLDEMARTSGVQVVSPAEMTAESLLALIQEGDWDLLHFVGHGEYSASDPDGSKIFLGAGTALPARRLRGSTLSQVAKRRPLVFFNACEIGRQGWALTGPGGWVQAWVGRGGVGAFVAPQWLVRDDIAPEFARAFYRALASGRTLGRSARLARRCARGKNRSDSSWLAYAVYGHPNARVTFGEGVPSGARPLRSKDNLQFLVRRVQFEPSRKPGYHFQLLNMSGEPIEVTKLWYESSGRRVEIKPFPKAPPVKLRHSKGWTSWIKLEKLPESDRQKASLQFRLQLSTGEILQSQPSPTP